MKIFRLISIAALIGLLLTGTAGLIGCGSDSDEPSLTKAEYIKQGDAICAKAEKERTDGIQRYAVENKLGPSNPLTRKKQEELVETVALPPLRQQVSALEDLGTPSEEGAEADAMVEKLDEVISEVEDDPSLALDGNPLEEVRPLATSYGFKVCATT